MVLIEVVFEMVTEVGPVLLNVAVPSGTVGLELQLAPVVHSLVVAPVQVPLTAYAVPEPSIASAPMHALPSSAPRRDRARAPGAAIRMSTSPIETSDPGCSAECAVRERNRCERIHPDPCNGTAGKTRPCATPLRRPATDVSQTLRVESRPINSGWGASAEKMASCCIHATPAAGRAARAVLPDPRGRDAGQKAGQRFILTCVTRISHG
jgi:hypothetical protein